ncbi:MAG: hypothetical protein Q4D27_05025 [Coriobacteriia bacterium]|nr:hypothetical protein [Coriobacteriia bacterium]
MKSILYLTDFAYQAKGRRYCDEDIAITSYLSSRFHVATCHPACCEPFEDAADMLVFRNAGAVAGFQDAYDAFRARVARKGLRTYNEFTGKADMAGKQYLLDMTAAGMRVIPTVDSLRDLGTLPHVASYVAKPKGGADSIGLEFLTRDELLRKDPADTDTLFQPAIDFRYEVSFYFLDGAFEYALYAPDPAARWKLVPYDATAADLAFAREFVEWNDIEHGIQRVDACRTQDGDLLLVELEDLNPYLSIDLLDAATRDRFLAHFADALERAAR